MPVSIAPSHPRDTAPQALLLDADMEFYKNYRGKPCIFRHTPTPLLPLWGRVGRHGIYISHSAIGIHTGYNLQSPLSFFPCLDFALYQSFADGHEETAITSLRLFRIDKGDARKRRARRIIAFCNTLIEKPRAYVGW